MNLPTATQQQFNSFLNSFDLSETDRKSGMVLLAATQVGANAKQVADVTGYPLSFVKDIESNMRANEIWVGTETHANWDEEPVEFLLHIGVARGLIQAKHQLLS